MATLTKDTRMAQQTAGTGDRIFFLDVSGGKILSASPEGGDLQVILAGQNKIPDGLVVDVEAGHIYWTVMGHFTTNDGSICRADLDGSNLTPIVPEGGTFTPKQLQLDRKNKKLYWCDREGMRVMRVNIDGSDLETLVETGRGDQDRLDQKRWCVGIALDVEREQMYWTQKGADDAGEGRIFRAGTDIPEGETPQKRTDIELLFDALPEPIDLDFDPEKRLLYWTDRGDPPRGNTVNRALVDKQVPAEPELLFGHLLEGIGLALDLKGDRLFVTDLGGNVYRSKLDGTERKLLFFAKGNLTGIAYAELAG